LSTCRQHIKDSKEIKFQMKRLKFKLIVGLDVFVQYFGLFFKVKLDLGPKTKTDSFKLTCPHKNLRDHEEFVSNIKIGLNIICPDLKTFLDFLIR
jgi:hypothetical protein